MPENRVAERVAEVLFGNVGSTLVIVAILVSTFGCVNGMILGGARVSYAMAREGLFFRSCAGLHPQAGTPAAALVYQGVWSMVLTLTGSYSELLTYTMFASVLFGGLTVAAVYRLRFTPARPAAPVSLLGLSVHAGPVPGDLTGVPDLRRPRRPRPNRDRSAAGSFRHSVLYILEETQIGRLKHAIQIVNAVFGVFHGGGVAGGIWIVWFVDFLNNAAGRVNP